MFLLPSLGLALVFAVVLGGKPERLLQVRLRATGLVFAALALQIALFTDGGIPLSNGVRAGVHLASYGLLLAFAVANARALSLLVLTSGLALNALVIAVNGGRMPVARGAAEAAGLVNTSGSNVALIHGRL